MTAENNKVVIRSYCHSTDEQATLAIFEKGILGLIPRNTLEMLQVYLSLHVNYPSNAAFLCAPFLLVCIMTLVFKISLVLSLAIVSCVTYLMLEYTRNNIRKFLLRYIQMSLKSDLANIEDYYMKNGDKRHMWVATIHEQVVGMVAIEQRKDEPHQAELRRMSVASNMQRRGIAKALLKTLEKYCMEQPEFTEIELETSNLQTPAIVLYERFGFDIVARRKFFTLLPIEFIKFVCKFRK